VNRLEVWERRTDWPLAGAAILFLAAYALPILNTNLHPGVSTICHVVDWSLWSMFIIDYGVRVYLASDRMRYVTRHAVDLAILALPALRPARALRVVVFLRVLNRRAALTLRGQLAGYVIGAAGLVVFTAALAILEAERGKPGANIETFGQALWWACVTVSTVGYGDHFPVTLEGRIVGVGLIMGGLALLGIVTASFASWLLEWFREVEEEEQAATRADIHALREEIRELRAELAATSRNFSAATATFTTEAFAPDPMKEREPRLP
jgi:voltage-gated potassium channel